MNIRQILDFCFQTLEDCHEIKNLEMVVEISEIKEYDKIIFLTITDGTGILKAILYRRRYLKPLVRGQKIKILADIGSYNTEIRANILKYEGDGLGEKEKEYRALIESLKERGWIGMKTFIEKDQIQTVGIISSRKAAGFKDFMDRALEIAPNFQYYLYETTVQGETAKEGIPSAIEIANRHQKADVLALIRGGGSKEDLACFNEEVIAKAIHFSKIPIVTGIGHQIDVSIADMVAVESFITPTAVAENLLVGDRYLEMERIISEKRNIIHQELNFYRSRLQEISEEVSRDLDSFQEYSMEPVVSYLNDRRDLLKQYGISFEQSLTSIEEKYKHQKETLEGTLGMLFDDYKKALQKAVQPQMKFQGTPIYFLSDLESGVISLEFLDGAINLKYEPEGNAGQRIRYLSRQDSSRIDQREA